jgi:hypothetical protein
LGRNNILVEASLVKSSKKLIGIYPNGPQSWVVSGSISPGNFSDSRQNYVALVVQDRNTGYYKRHSPILLFTVSLRIQYIPVHTMDDKKGLSGKLFLLFTNQLVTFTHMSDINFFFNMMYLDHQMYGEPDSIIKGEIWAIYPFRGLLNRIIIFRKL